MFNLSDKELDRLSREAANAYEVENNTSSWDALEQRLDQELGTAPTPNPAVPPPRSLIFPFAYTSLIILLVGTGYLLLKSGKKSNTETTKNFTLKNKETEQAQSNNSQQENSAAKTEYESKNDAASANNTLPKKENDVLINKNNEKEKHNLPAVHSAAENKPGDANAKSHNEKIAGNLPATINSKAHTNTSNARIDREKDKEIRQADNAINKGKPDNGLKNLAENKTQNNKISDSYDETKKGKGKLKNNDHYVAGKKSKSITDLNSIDEEKDDFKYAHQEQTSRFAKHSAIRISDSALLAEAINHNSAGINKSKSLNTDRSLQIGILFAPDFSKVKYAYEGNRLGNSIGLTIDYHLLRRLSVNTGIIYASKYYEMSGENFHPTISNIAPLNADIDFIKGSFKMIEIPLNIRYDISIEGNTIVFGSAGLSSYLMQNQQYSYLCHYSLGYSRWLNQSYDSPQSFWFSTLNLSLGFETNISNSISFQMDPYFKIPLKGVGAGNVQLSSYGINMAIKYSPALKKSRR